jgi:hypothetical protein
MKTLNLRFKDYLNYSWELGDQIVGRKTNDQNQPVPRGRDPKLYEYVQEQRKQTGSKSMLCYCSFTLATHWSRPQVYEDVKDKKFIYFGNMYERHKKNKAKPHPADEYLSFLDDLKKSKFIISPRGNGVDCYRNWDALYEKTIPIVCPRECPIMSAYTDLPFLFIDDYAELTEEFLTNEYERILETEYDFSRLFIGHWEQLFRPRRLNKYVTLFR